MTKLYFVRHAQPNFAHVDDCTRPLTAEGMEDRKIVLETLKDKSIDAFYCSPYLRSVQTIEETAEHYGMEIQLDERLREREKGNGGNLGHDMFRMRWEDHDAHEEGGESINMVQGRNIEAIQEILAQNEGKNIVIGTHGTALSAILDYYTPFGLEGFMRILDWMPYVVEVDFDGREFVGMTELAHVEKVFK
jgi:2,3-bisphosphoglycerate-dependent phosphoglycerate mutase